MMPCSSIWAAISHDPLQLGGAVHGPPPLICFMESNKPNIGNARAVRLLLDGIIILFANDADNQIV